MTLLSIREQEAVKWNRDQTLGLSSCPEDADGKECELCAEQVDRLVTTVILATRDAIARQVRERLKKELDELGEPFDPGFADGMDAAATFIESLEPL